MLDDGTFDYCGHHFDAMIFMYPEYSKPEIVDFLKSAISAGAKICVKGNLTRGFDGKAIDGGFIDAFKLPEGDKIDPEKLFGIKRNDIALGCRLEDGSVVMSSYASMRDGVPAVAEFELDGKNFEVKFIGIFAIKTDGAGKIMKMSAGKLYSLSRDGESIYSYPDGKTVEI